MARGDDGVNDRLPALGARGEGWAIGQFVLIGLVVLTGLPGLSLSGPFGAARWTGLIVGVLGLLIGAAVVGVSVRDLGRQVTPWPRPPDHGHFVEEGLYRFVRHPMYAGLILLAFGWALVSGSLITLFAALGLATWMDLKARREEAWLLDRYPRYAAYRARTRRFLPGIY
jgi:protein-S-isoprenylcysteine O-methyltransferase Ste14